MDLFMKFRVWELTRYKGNRSPKISTVLRYSEYMSEAVTRFMAR